MSTFKPGDKVTLLKPPFPFPSHWLHQNAESPFGITLDHWNTYLGKELTIEHLNSYGGCAGVTFREEPQRCTWPLECIQLLKASKNSPIPCDCPWEVVLNQGCKKVEHC